MKTIIKGVKASSYREIFFNLAPPMMLAITPFMFEWIFIDQQHYPIALLDLLFSLGNVFAVIGVIFALVKFYIAGKLTESKEVIETD